MKILLGNFPWSKSGYYGVRAGSRWPHFEKCGSTYMPFPFFLAYSTAMLEKDGFDVKLIDGIAEGISAEEFYHRLKDYSPDLVVYEVSTPSIELDLQVAKETKNILGRNVPVLFCGAHHEMYGTEFLKKEIAVDLVIQGEYEFTLLEVARRLASSGQLEDVQGLIYRSENGDIKINPKRPLEMDLQKYPWPARHHLPMDKYIDLPGGIPAPSLQLWASRGCPYQCIFCSWPQIMYDGSKYRVREPKDVVDEIEWCVKQYGFKSFYFDDDTFNIGKPRILAICEEIKNRKLNLPWAVMARADCMDRELLIALKEAGLTALKYGVESGVQEIVNASGKNLDLSKVRETVKITKDLCIGVHLTFTFGLPGETWDTINKTIDLAIELDPDSLQFSIVTPFPGSKYFEALDSKGYILSKKWEEYDGYNRAVIKTDNLSNLDLEKALKKANRRWRVHKFKKMLRNDTWSTIKLVALGPLDAYKAYRG